MTNQGSQPCLSRAERARAGIFTFAVAVALFAPAAPALAALGGDAASVQADQRAMNAAEQISAGSGYQVHELRTGAGLKVREYLADGGQVFGVAWEGPMLPDLRQLLDGYFTRYTDALHAQRGGHGHREIDLGDLVVESAGHMRAFVGRAYLPQSLPQGVGADVIR